MLHYLRNDTRINVLESIINSIQKQLDEIELRCRKDSFIYWDSIYADDVEHLIGIVFIALQNYINSSISDLYPELTKLYKKYSLDKKTKMNSETTRIELIIALANYYKHRDLPSELHKHTTNPFDDLSIKYKQSNSKNKKFSYVVGSESPIFNGLSLLSDRWNLKDLVRIVVEWRENLWRNEREK